MQPSDYTAANRLAWDQAAPIHQQHRLDRWLADFTQTGHSCLDAVATDMLQGIGVRDRAVTQLCCNNGRELISIANLGAAPCQGFDISAEFLGQARLLNEVAGSRCRFEQADVYKIPHRFDQSADLIYISIGTLGWMPDLPAFLDVVRRLLRPEGWLAMYEMHPMLGMFDNEDQDPPPLRHSYFRTEPFIETDGLDYWEGTTYDSAPTYWFQHTLSDIIGGVLDAGFEIRSFREYDHDISEAFAYMDRVTVRPPLCFTLTARKGGDD